MVLLALLILEELVEQEQEIRLEMVVQVVQAL
jgi:hypothetical protein